MSGNPQPDAAAMHSFVQAGQAFAQGFMSFLAQQHNAASAAVPHNEAIVGLQKTFAERHAALWQSMLQHGQGAEGRVEVKDKRFAAPAWSESPYFDYLRQAYLLNAEFLDRLAEAVPADAAARERLKFFTRQFVDALAPSNFAPPIPSSSRRR
jgi:polyhydroxyalkanoate synthase